MNTEELCSGMFSDIMDSLGYRNQIISGFCNNWSNFNPSCSFIGRARTVLIENCKTDNENIAMGLNFLSQIRTSEILIIKGSEEFAYFGELMTRLSIRQGIEGVIIDGLTRDTKYTHNQCKLPIAARGYSPIDIKGRGRVQACDVAIQINNVKICKNDLIFADNEAICVIPKNIESQVLFLVSNCIKEEKNIVFMIDNGYSVSEILKKVKSF